MTTIAAGTTLTFTIPTGQVATIAGDGIAVLVQPVGTPMQLSGTNVIGPFGFDRIVTMTARTQITFMVAAPATGSGAAAAPLALVYDSSGNVTGIKGTNDVVLPLYSISNGANNALEYDGVGLYIDATSLVSNNGIATFESIIAPQTIATPVVNLGDKLLVGGSTFNKVYIGNNDEQSFIYVLDRAVTKAGTMITDLTSINNSNGNSFQIGYLTAPGDSLLYSPDAKVSITVTGSSNLPPCEISMAFSAGRTQAAYRASKTVASGYASKSVTFEMTLAAYATAMAKLGQVSADTAATAYPNPAQIADFNLAANVKFPIFFKWLAPLVTPSTCSLVSVSASITIAPPKRFQNDGTPKRRAAKQPFPTDDIWNQPLGTKTVARSLEWAHNWASTGSITTGTLNASGTAGSNIITVYRTEKLKVGMIVAVSAATGTSDTDPNTFANSVSAAYGTYLQPNTKITAILSATTIQVDKAPIASFEERGKPYDAIHCLAFFYNAETLSARMGQAGGSTIKGPLTGITKADTAATAFPVSFAVAQAKSTDPIALWNMGASGYVLSTNGWLSLIPDSHLGDNSGEGFVNFQFYMRTPTIINNAFLNDADKNLCLITEDGRYVIEGYKCLAPDSTGSGGTYGMGRGSVTSLNHKSVPYLLNRAERGLGQYGGYSLGSRAYGGPLIGGLIRVEEMAAIPDSTATGETDAVILANLVKSGNAINHKLAADFSPSQLRSYNRCPDPAVQGTKLPCYSYIGQMEAYKPAIAQAGTGYAAGDSLELVGGAYITPMRVVVDTVGTNGVVTGFAISTTGQYETAPTGLAAAAFLSITGVGTGFVLNMLTLPDATINTDALAFPPTSINSGFQYPAIQCDGGVLSRYAGSLCMGSILTMDPLWTRAAIDADMLARRKAAPTAYRSSYEFHAVQVAILNYGIIIIDVAGNSQLFPMVDRSVDVAKFNKLIQNDGAFTYGNLQQLKSMLTYVENISPSGPAGGAYRVAPPAQLYPVGN